MRHFITIILYAISLFAKKHVENRIKDAFWRNFLFYAILFYLYIF